MFKKTGIVLLGIFVLFSMLSVSGDAGQRKRKREKQELEIYIPQEVKTIMEEGVVMRQPRQDVPFEIVRFLYVPAQQNVHAVFMFEIKNADLDFQSESMNPENAQTVAEEQPDIPQIIKKDFKIFAQFYERNKGDVGKVVKESYVPASFQEDSSTYRPEQKNIYSIGYPFPAGDYLLALAVTSPDLSKIGLQYYEFSLPDQFSFKDKLGLTSVFFLKSMKQNENPELVTKVHMNSFVYSMLEIFPKVKNIIAPGEPVDIFYFIYGCQPEKETNQYNIGIAYRVLEEGTTVIGFKESTFRFPLISHPLPLVDDKNNPLKQGSYILEIDIIDNVSGRSLIENIEFEIK
ncbi:MAG: hypothetical protein OEZ52_10080 [Candidatus Aminicenantes bacterium]|nr:hypothetical protein [Candidatus Aminicenantes bacterium]MDH5743883.1 hypothetical protein [Candidatus Aminicenantes bacterium]